MLSDEEIKEKYSGLLPDEDIEKLLLLFSTPLKEEDENCKQ